MAAPHPAPRKAIEAMPAYRPPLEGRRGALRLDFNERTTGAPRAALEALSQLTGEDLACYPEYAPYIEKLSRALGVNVDEVLPTNATDEAIQTAILTYVDPGERVLLASPTFAMFAVYARIAGAEPLEVPYEGPSLDFPEEAYLRALREDRRVRLAVLIDPNNPTATDVPSGFVERVCETRPDVAVLVDEAYGAFIARTAIPLVARFPNLIVTQTFSKAHGLAGLRIGHVVSSSVNIRNMGKVRSPYSVNVAAMAAAGALLDAASAVNEPAAYVSEALPGRALLEEGLRARGIEVVRSGASFALARFGDGHARVVAALRERGVLVRDRSSDRGLQGCVRITAGPREHVERLFSALDDAQGRAKAAPQAEIRSEADGHRRGSVERRTRETEIQAAVDLDGAGDPDVETPIGFLSHMLEALARHSLIDIRIRVQGDLHVDQHHSVEDAGMVLGQAISKALGDRRGISRAGWARHVMDEALAHAAIDLSGRSHLTLEATFDGTKVGELDVTLLHDFFEAIARALGAGIHIDLIRGRNDHHRVEAIFKAFARALRMAISLEPRLRGRVLSSKGSLDLGGAS